MPHGVVDWDDLKIEYATTKISYEKLAKKYGVTKSALEKIANKQKWVEARRKHCEKTVAKAIDRASTHQAKVLAKELQLADEITKVLDRALKDAKQFNKHLIQRKEKKGKDEKWWVEEQEFSKIDTKALKEAAETLRIVEDMKRRMNNMLTEPERQKFEIEREKLAMDKAKNSINDDDDDTTGVVVLAEILEDDDDD